MWDPPRPETELVSLALQGGYFVFFFFFFTEHRKLYSSTLLRRRAGSLQYGILLGFRKLPLDALLLIPLLLLLGSEPPLLFCPGFQVIVALGAVGYAEEQGGRNGRA